MISRLRNIPGSTAVLLAVLALAVAACSSSSPTVDDGTDPTESAEGAQISVDLALDATTVALGEPIEVTLTVSNRGERSVSTPIDVVLVAADGTETPFHRTSLFVPFGDTATETVAVTTARWHPEPGSFEVRATVTDPAFDASPGAAAFEVGAASRAIPVFEDATAEAGLVTDVPVPECGQFANGAAWGDVDGDGWPDLLVTRLGDPVQLFVNQGDGTFVEQSTERGVVASGANGAAFADYDNDGDADLILVSDGPDALFRNDGTGRFEDVSESAGIGGDDLRGMSAAWGDYDGDGLLDVYVANYMECTGTWTTEAEIIANVGYHDDVLYRNQGDGTFVDVSHLLDDGTATAAAFAAAWVDVDGDELPDLYVANDFVGLSPDHNRLWRNAGPVGSGWRFDDVSLESGTGLYMNTMGIGVGDVDRDGDLDLALSNIGGNKLLRNRGDGNFDEEQATGIERPHQGIDYVTVTWGTVFYDFDLDGWEDLFMAAGNLQQSPEVVVGPQANMLFVNDAGERFLDVSALTGVDAVGESKGVAVADYDRDGDVDLFVVDQAGTPHLYRNVTPREGRHWLEVALVGTRSNRDGCGAAVTVVAGEQSMLRPALCSSGASGSGHDAALHFGLGTAHRIDRVEVRWPSGELQTISGADVDQLLTIEEATIDEARAAP